MIPDQFPRILLESAVLRGWESRLDPKQPVPASDPQVHLYLENMITLLELEYHKQEGYLLLAINPDRERYLAFRFYPNEKLQEWVIELFKRQFLINQRNFPGHVEVLSKLCDRTYLETLGEAKHRVDGKPGFLRAIERNFKAGKPMNQLAEPLKREPFRLKPVPQWERETESEPDQNAIETEQEATLEVREAFAREHLRIRKLLAIAIKQTEQVHLNLEDQKLLRRNLAQWIHNQHLELILLMPTQDATTRAPEKGVAYFDRRVKYPQTEGDYPQDPAEESEALMFAGKNPESGWVEGTNRIELYNPNTLDSEQLWEFFREAIIRYCSFHWRKWYPKTADYGDFPVVKNWNMILSPRIFELKRSICAHPKYNRIPRNEPVFLAALAALDFMDHQFLGDRTRSYMFWDSLKVFNPLAWAECYNQIG